MKNIILLATHYGRAGDAGSMRTTAMARRLAEEGYVVKVIVPATSGRLMVDSGSRVEFDGKVEITYIRSLSDFRSSLLRRITFEIDFSFRLLSALRGLQPNFLVGAYPPAFSPFVGLFFSLFKRTVFILEVRDLMAGALQANGYVRSRFLLWLARLYENILLRSATFVAIASPGMISPIQRVHPRVQLIRAYNGVENTTIEFNCIRLTDQQSGIFSKLLSHINFKPSDKIVIYAGALTQSYDLETIILGYWEAAVDNKKLVILGEGEKRRVYEDRVRSLKIPNVYFADFVDRQVALAMLERCCVGVHAFNGSQHWGYVLGNKIFDYMAVGLPVLFSGVGATADLVESSGGGLVSEPGNHSDFSRKLEILMTKMDLTKVGFSGKSYVFKHWTRQNQLDLFIEDLKSSGLG